MCANSKPPTPVIDEFQWAPEPKWTAPSAILLQAACCYEGRNIGHLFEENKKSLLTILETRLQGISGYIVNVQGDRLGNVSVTVSPLDKRLRMDRPKSNATSGSRRTMRTGETGFYHFALEAGKYRVIIEGEGQFDTMSSAFNVITIQSDIGIIASLGPS